MKILVITGIHPTRKNMAAGVFITRRLNKLKAKGVIFDAYYLSENMSILSKIFRRLLRRPSFKEKEIISIDGINYSPIFVKMNIWDMIYFYQRIGFVISEAILKSIKIDEYDLVHVDWTYPHGYAVALMRKNIDIPYILCAQGSDIHTNPHRNPKSINSVLLALESADRVIFVSRKLLESAQELGYKKNNNIVLPTGVDTDKFFLMDKMQVKKELNLNEKNKIVGFVGNLKWIKRADKLPDIFKGISMKYKDVQFVVIGDGIYRTTIERQCKKYNLNVMFKGRINPDKIPMWMNAFDVLILPSRNEGFPNVCIEAQACGCQVVGSNAGGIPEAIGSGGTIVDDTGVNFEKDFSNAVIMLLENPFSREQVRRRATEFDWENITNKQIDLYNIVLKTHGSF